MVAGLPGAGSQEELLQQWDYVFDRREEGEVLGEFYEELGVEGFDANPGQGNALYERELADAGIKGVVKMLKQLVVED